MIFLNRILSEQTKIELDNHEGTQYWYIGVESDGGTTLDESVIAISNKISGDTNFGEEFIKIFKLSKQNWEWIPEFYYPWFRNKSK